MKTTFATIALFSLFGGLVVAQNRFDRVPLSQPPTQSASIDFDVVSGNQGPSDKTLHVTSQQLLNDYRSTENSEKRDAIRVKLRTIVQRQFTSDQQKRADQLAALRKKVDRLAELHQRRNESAAQIVNDRVDTLLRQADGLGWGAEIQLPINPYSDSPMRDTAAGF